MKKIFLSTLAVTICLLSANAQVKFGPEVGLNMSIMVSNTHPGSTMKIGARVGGTADISLGDHFALQPGLFYTMMGSKFSVLGTDLTFNANYIHIPILVLYKFGEPDGNRFFLYLGPAIGYCIGGKSSSSGTSQSIKVGSDASSDIKPLDIGINSGIGYQMSSGLLIRVGAFEGVTNVDPSQGGSTHNVAYQISLAWLFGGSRY